MLPGLDGFDVLERVRRARQRLPVIMVTADDDIQRAVDDGATVPIYYENRMAKLVPLQLSSISFSGME